MRFNVFEGARRIAMLIGALWVVIYGTLSWNSEPYTIGLTYMIDWVGSQPYRTDAPCGLNNTVERSEVKLPSGKEIPALLCFRSQKDDRGEGLIPYKLAPDGSAWMHLPFSTEVMEYKRSVAEQFSLPPSDTDIADELYKTARFKKLKESTKEILIGLAVIWTITFVLGWIIRGFLGIPQGKDFRP